jgi:hypothetical protein
VGQTVGARSPGQSPRALARARRGAALALLLALASVGAPGCGSEDAEAPAPIPAPEAMAAPPTPVEVPAEAPAAPRRGLWGLAEGSPRKLDHPERIPDQMRDARAHGATDLFGQGYRAGRSG